MKVELLQDWVTWKGDPYKKGDVIELDFGTAKDIVSAGIAKNAELVLEKKDELQEQPNKPRKNDGRSKRADKQD